MAEQWSLEGSLELEDRQFRLWCELLDRRIGLQLPEHRRSFLETSLAIRMREINCNDAQSYYEMVAGGGRGLVEWSILVDRLTVQETRFFRDPPSMDLAKKHLQQRASEKSLLHIWSVGCATGEEPYSLAMIASEALTNIRNFSVIATDISQPAISKARAGIYGSRKLQHVPEILQAKYFEQDHNQIRVKSELRERVGFARLNILDLDKSPYDDFDLIYCQNVLIYFRRWRRKDIVNQLTRRLAPGGMIILGSGEVTDWHSTDLERVQNDKTLAFIKPKESQVVRK